MGALEGEFEYRAVSIRKDRSNGRILQICVGTCFGQFYAIKWTGFSSLGPIYQNTLK